MIQNNGASIAQNDSQLTADELEELFGETIEPTTPVEHTRQVEEVASEKKQERETEQFSDGLSRPFPAEHLPEALRKLADNVSGATNTPAKQIEKTVPISAEALLESMGDDRAKQFLDSNLYLKKDDNFPAPMMPEAFRGISGEVVDLICENTELNREAVLVQFLVSIGNMVGREPYRWAESEHHTNEFVGIVGTTANGAKGGSWRAIRDLLYFVDKDYTITKAHGGYQSPEAIVDSIHDDRFYTNSDGEEECDPGKPDKRLLIVEEELSRIFRLSARKDNQISEVVRLAWDEPPVIYLKGKIKPSIATAPHISLIGHITPTDLQDTMQNRDTFNGFANRFLWVASRRSKSIPFPQKVSWTKHGEIIAHIRGVMNDFGPNRATPVEECNQLEVDASGQKEWIRFYHNVNKQSENSGMIMGALLARAKPHVMRLAAIYAILDRSREITGKHFQAAIAVWDYCVVSAMWGFGDKTGNRNADQIIWALKRSPSGLTRTEIANTVLRKSLSGQEIEAALATLRQSGQADFRRESETGKGRKVERWFAVN